MTSIVEGKATFDISQVVEIEKLNATLNQTIGAQKETIKILEKQNSERDAKHKTELDKAQQEVKITTNNSTDTAIKRRFNRCTNCSYYHDYAVTVCMNCGHNPRSFSVNGTTTGQTVEYKNLEDTVELIRKEESKKIKTDVIALEEKLNDTEFDLNKKVVANKELKRKLETEVTEAKSKLRKTHTEEVDKLKKRIKELAENKTDAEIEAKRVEELADLKLEIEHLEGKIKAYASLNPFKIRAFIKEEEARATDADIKVAERKDRIRETGRIHWYGRIKNWLRDQNMFIWANTEPAGPMYAETW